MKSPVLLEELVNLLQTAWKAQMDFLAWYEIIKPPRSTRSVAESSFGEEVDERTDEADRDEGTRAEKRSLKWVSPGEKARWAEDCRWLRKVARSECSRSSSTYPLSWRFVKRELTPSRDHIQLWTTSQSAGHVSGLR